MDDYTLDALNREALESRDRIEPDDDYGDDPVIDDEPPFGSFPEERGTDLNGTPYGEALRELRAREEQS